MYYTWVKHVESRSPPTGSSTAAYTRLPTLEEVKVERQSTSSGRRLSTVHESDTDGETLFSIDMEREKKSNNKL